MNNMTEKTTNNPVSLDLYNLVCTGGVCCSLTAGMWKGAAHSGPSVLIQNNHNVNTSYEQSKVYESLGSAEQKTVSD